MKSIAVAPAKVILTGEHFVVYGTTAIVSAVNIYSRATASRKRGATIVTRSGSFECAMPIDTGRCRILKGGDNARTLLEPISQLARTTLSNWAGHSTGLDLSIDSDIPVGVGLGSSAAVAVSTVAAIARLFRKRCRLETIRKRAFESERLIHKIPSGIDQTISTYGGVIAYQKEKPFKRVTVGRTFPIIIGDSGRRRSTGDIVSGVRALLAERADMAEEVLRSANMISRKALTALRQGDTRRLGQLMNQNQELLRRIEVSTAELDKMISAACEAGAFGAKLTGAGGGGSMIALASPDRIPAVVEAIREAGGTPFVANIERRGVRSWLVN
jgi:mevalonate kinase